MSGRDRAMMPKTPCREPGREEEQPSVFLMTDSLQIGGTERQFAALAQSLMHERFQVSLGCLQRRGSFLEGMGDIAEFNLGGSFFNFRAQRARCALARHLRAAGTALAHSFDFYSNLMLIPTARLAGIPVVIGSHRQLGDLLTPLQSYAQGMVFRLCDRIVCNSRASAGRLVDQGLSERKVVVIPNGLPATAFSEARPSLPRSEGTLRVGLIARMNNPVKNHAGFLRAAARLTQKFSPVEFLLVGDGPLRPDLESLAGKLGLGPRVSFLGERLDIPGLLAAMDVSVVFSSSESLSNVALESMAAGVPVVATRVGGNPEVVQDGETGLLVTPGNEEELAHAIERLIAQPSLRTNLGQRAKKLARSAFTMDRVVKQYGALYVGLLAEKSGGLRRRPRRVPTSVSSRQLRVAIVAASPRWIGGQGVQAHILTRNWQNDSAVDARFVPIDPDFPFVIRWVERIPFLRTVTRMPFYLAALWQATKDGDIVHIFSASYWSFLLATMPAWVVARLMGKKVLIHYHSGEARDHLRRSDIALRVLRASDRIVVPSRYLADVFWEFDLEAQVVPNTVDLVQFSYRSRGPVKPRLVCTRGFHPYYSVDIVVRAFALVKKEYPEARLCLVGIGPMESQIRELVKQLGLADVDFAGPVSHKEIGRYYEESDIFINASWLDNMPVSILEAFASGTPVVTTAPEGIRYVVEHERTGLLCEPGDSKALGENVIRLLREPELASRLARNGHDESQGYQWNVVRKQWLEVYRSILPLQPQKGTCTRAVFASSGNR